METGSGSVWPDSVKESVTNGGSRRAGIRLRMHMKTAGPHIADRPWILLPAAESAGASNQRMAGPSTDRAARAIGGRAAAFFTADCSLAKARFSIWRTRSRLTP